MLFIVSISGHLSSVRNCHVMCRLSAVFALGLNANGPVVRISCRPCQGWRVFCRSR